MNQRIDVVVEATRVALARARCGRSSKSFILLSEQRDRWEPVLARLSCVWSDTAVLSITASDSGLGFGAILAVELERALRTLPRDSRTCQSLVRAEEALAKFMDAHGPRRGATAIRSRTRTPESLAATSGLGLDLLDVLTSFAEAIGASKSAGLLLVDNLTSLTDVELGALITALHRCATLQLPLRMVALGPPASRARVGGPQTVRGAHV